MSIVLGLFVLASTHSVVAQTPKTQRPVKNPPQYPNIIDLENKGAAKGKASETATADEPAGTAISAALVRAVESLAVEVRTLVQEMRALNVRQQAQLDLLRLTRGDLRIDSYERELRTVTDRLAQIERDEQALRSAMTPEGLAAQVSRLGTLDRDETMRVIKRDLESRLTALLPERERLRTRKTELEAMVGGFREASEKAERRIELVEEALKQLATPPTSEERKPSPSERKPDFRPDSR